jgi:hypothetical protein
MGKVVMRMGVRVENVKQFFNVLLQFVNLARVNGVRVFLEVVNNDEALQQGGVGLAAKGRSHRGFGRVVI